MCREQGMEPLHGGFTHGTIGLMNVCMEVLRMEQLAFERLQGGFAL